MPSLFFVVVGAFLILAGINAIRTRHFATGIQDGPPSVVLGWLSLVAGVATLVAIAWYLQVEVPAHGF